MGRLKMRIAVAALALSLGAGAASAAGLPVGQRLQPFRMKQATGQDWDEFRRLKNVAEANKEVSRTERGKRALLKKGSVR